MALREMQAMLAFRRFP